MNANGRTHSIVAGLTGLALLLLPLGCARQDQCESYLLGQERRIYQGNWVALAQFASNYFDHQAGGEHCKVSTILSEDFQAQARAFFDQQRRTRVPQRLTNLCPQCISLWLSVLKTSHDRRGYAETEDIFRGLILLSDIRVATEILKAFRGERLAATWSGGHDAFGYSYWLICREAVHWANETHQGSEQIYELFAWLDGGMAAITSHYTEDGRGAISDIGAEFLAAHPSIQELVELVETEAGPPEVLEIVD